mmetsp:Transcript_35706/g.112200  ORF Transcript_35706/g.112200 Transcript_35706/m.112200 type:complete len:88 (-) Transcript_35706:84-347(-)
MLPAAHMPAEVASLKIEAYQQLRTGDHVASREEWHDEESREKTEADVPWRPYLEAPPPLTPRQRQLYGLEPYSDDATEAEAPGDAQP